MIKGYWIKITESFIFLHLKHIDTNNKIWFNQKSIVRKYRILDLPNILELKIKGLKPRRIAVVIVSFCTISDKRRYIDELLAHGVISFINSKNKGIFEEALS